jgi:hypothetical protein
MGVAGMAMPVTVRMPGVGVRARARIGVVMVLMSVAGGSGGTVRVRFTTHPAHCTQPGASAQLGVILIGHYDNWLRLSN